MRYDPQAPRDRVSTRWSVQSSRTVEVDPGTFTVREEYGRKQPIDVRSVTVLVEPEGVTSVSVIGQRQLGPGRYGATLRRGFPGRYSLGSGPVADLGKLPDELREIAERVRRDVKDELLEALRELRTELGAIEAAMDARDV
jgi:hypothetical protein